MPEPHLKRAPARPLPARLTAVSGAVLAVSLVLLGTGCAAFDKAFGKQEAVVQFQSGTPDSVRLRVRAACSHVPNAVPEPLPTDHLVSDLLNNVRYRVDHASDANLAELQQCLQKFRSVVGVTVSSPSGM